MNRRDFLLGTTALALSPTISIADIEKGETSVIFLFLGGGISQIEFINPIPDAPVEFRSTRGHIKHKDGFLLGGDFGDWVNIPMAVVRSFHHRDANHETATQWVMTSEANFPNRSPNWPSYGATLTRSIGTNGRNGIPNYVKLNKIEGDGPAFLGSQYMGYDANEDGVKNLFLNVSQEQFNQRKRILEQIDRDIRRENLPLYRDWRDLKNQAISIIEGEAARAFDLNLESPEVLAEYKTGFGKDVLRAIRLIEGGTRFVTLNHPGWDMHGDISNGFQNRAPELSFYVAKLYSELEKRGLLEKTLVVISSEFGRTSRINQTVGRDHQATTNSLVFMGGNTQSRVIGTTDQTASSVIDQSVGPKDLAWTIFNFLHLDKHFEIMDIEGRPRQLIESQAQDILLL